MTAEDLMKFLKDVDPKTPVLLSSDGEGNHYRKVYSVAVDNFIERERGEVECYGEPVEGSQECVLLWPT